MVSQHLESDARFFSWCRSCIRLFTTIDLFLVNGIGCVWSEIYTFTHYSSGVAACCYHCSFIRFFYDYFSLLHYFGCFDFISYLSENQFLRCNHSFCQFYEAGRIFMSMHCDTRKVITIYIYICSSISMCHYCK